MDVGAAAAALTAKELWEYNRDNFLFDREQRLENEQQILDYRARQAEQWREDIRDIIELTERKMDNYLIITTLELGMCVSLLAEGRLEPGTPPWLLNFYVLSLAAGFMYLLMSIWLAMHASVTAQCSSVRLLTQFVRLPVPTWEQLQEMRTYGKSFENMHFGHAFRVPFTESLAGQSKGKPSTWDLDAASGANDGGPEPRGRPPWEASREMPEEEDHRKADPWGMERHKGDSGELYELVTQPAAMRRHIVLAKRAAEQYQCYDAVARVAMTFGTNQLLNAIAYYGLGYVAVQDGAIAPAWCVSIIMACVGTMMVHLDFSLTRRQWMVLYTLSPLTLLSASYATYLYSLDQQKSGTPVLQHLLSFVYLSNAVWLVTALRACGLEYQANGALLPMRFRAVLYLDVFGWLSKERLDLPSGEPARREPEFKRSPHPPPPGSGSRAASASGLKSESRESPRGEAARLQEQLRRDVDVWNSPDVLGAMSGGEKDRAERLVREAQGALGADVNGKVDESSCSTSDGDPIKPAPKDASSRASDHVVQLTGYSDLGVEVPYLYDPEDGSVHMQTPRLELKLGPGRVVRTLSSFNERLEQYDGIVAGDESRPSEPPSFAPTVHPPTPDHDSHLTDDWTTGTDFAPFVPQPHGLASRVVGAMKALLLMHEPTDYTPLVTTDMDAGAASRAATRTTGGSAASSSYMPMTQSGSRAVRFAPDDPRSPSRPSGEVEEAPPGVFQPTSYASTRFTDIPDEPIVTGHDLVNPGRVPGKLFHRATLLVALLWTMGFFVSIGDIDLEEFDNPLSENVYVEEVDPVTGQVREEEEIQAVVGTNPQGLPELIPRPHAPVAEAPAWPEGKRILVEWPEHTAFIPRALSCDPEGGELIVADDFGLYVGRVFGGSGAYTGAEDDQRVKFNVAKPCASLEGQTIRDISLVCSEVPPTEDTKSDGEPPLSRHCSAMVLTRSGSLLVECPLTREHDEGWPGDDQPPTQGRRLAAEFSGADAIAQESQPWLTGLAANESAPWQVTPARARRAEEVNSQASCRKWELPDKWLKKSEDKDEKIAAFTVHDECFLSRSRTDLRPGCGYWPGTDFTPSPLGCFLIGTSAGRLIAVGASAADETQLVPRRLVHQDVKGMPLARGSLGVLPGNIVIALWTNTSNVVAFDQDGDRELGVWSLPHDCQWLMLCSSHDSLFALGLKGGKSVEIYRFPMPEVLLDRIKQSDSETETSQRRLEI